MNGAAPARPQSMGMDVAGRGRSGALRRTAGPDRRRAAWRRNRRLAKTRLASSVLKFDIAILFNRHLLERLHRAFKQRHVVGISRLAVLTAARGRGAVGA